MKRMTVFVLAVLIIVNLLPTPTLALGNNEIQPRYTYIFMVGAKLVVDDHTGIATCTGSLETYSSHKLRIICRLQRLDAGTWTTVTSWTKQVDNKRQVILTESYSINTDKEYRVSVFAYVYDGNTVIESASKNST
jgi:hypothetical protein